MSHKLAKSQLMALNKKFSFVYSKNCVVGFCNCAIVFLQLHRNYFCIKNSARAMHNNFPLCALNFKKKVFFFEILFWKD